MMNSLETNALAVLDGVLKDAVQAYPKLSSLNRDKLRLYSLVENRGLSSLMIDLPNLDSLLLQGLETGRLVPTGPCSRMVSKTTLVPRLFSGLWLRIFDKLGCLRTTPDVNAIMFIRQLSNCLKSVELECSVERIENTVEEYYNIEGELRHPTLLWEDDEFDAFDQLKCVNFVDMLNGEYNDKPSMLYKENQNVRLLLRRLQLFCNSVAGVLGLYDPYSFTASVGVRSETRRLLKHGRGAVSDLPRGANRFAFPGWSTKLERDFDSATFSAHNYSCGEVCWAETPSSKLLSVPKSLSKPRLIAAEPTSNQWCQQITLQWLVSRMETSHLRHFVDLSDQSKSQRMVSRASLDRKLATVDLSSASDRLSCWAIERFLKVNPTLLSPLMSSRTSILRDGVTNRPAIMLRKFATQGTAVTFPIQSLFFLCCVGAALGCTTIEKLVKRYKGKVRVYGDDLILPVEGYANLALILDALQLKVNSSKSFVTGSFRESCGADAFCGYDITPVKPKVLEYRGPTSVQSLIDASNNFFNKGYWHTSVAIERIISAYIKLLPITAHTSGVTGRTSFCGGNIDHLKQRWNVNLHRVEVRTLVFQAKARRKPINDITAYFQFLSENPSPSVFWESGIPAVPTLHMKRGWVECDRYHVGT